MGQIRFLLSLLLVPCLSLSLWAEQYTFKHYVPKVGDEIRVENTMSIVQSMDMKVVQEYREEKKTIVYTVKVLKVENKIMREIEVTFEKWRVEVQGKSKNPEGERTVGPKVDELPVKGLKVKITFDPKGKFQNMTVMAGKMDDRLKGAIRQRFATAPGTDKAKDNPFLPEEAVTIGKPWSISLETIAKVMEIPVRHLDKKGADCKGVLKSVAFDGQKHLRGNFNVKASFGIVDFGGLKGVYGKGVVTVDGAASLDGKCPSQKVDMSFQLTGKGKFQGMDVSLSVTVKGNLRVINLDEK